MRTIHACTALIVSLLFFVPLITLTIEFHGVGLAGVTQKDTNMRFSLTQIIEQKFQRHFAKQFFEATGLSGLLIKSDNQLNYFLFGQLSSNPKSNVLLGNNKQLLERVYLKPNNQIGKANRKRLLRTADRLGLLNQSLSARGIPMLLVISPNKPAFYPESIPTQFRVKSSDEPFENLDFMKHELDKQGVSYIDGLSYLRQKERELSLPMFASSGTHWNQMGGCLIAGAIFEQAQLLRSNPLPVIECKVTGTRSFPAYPDTDLLQMANLWFPELLTEPAPIVKTIGHLPDSSNKPELLIIGSSFVWELLRQFEASKVVRKTEFLYYFKRRVVNSADRGKKIDRAAFDFDAALQRKQLVLIEINQAALGKASFGFAKAFLDNESKRAIQ